MRGIAKAQVGDDSLAKAQEPNLNEEQSERPSAKSIPQTVIRHNYPAPASPGFPLLVTLLLPLNTATKVTRIRSPNCRNSSPLSPPLSLQGTWLLN